MNDKRSLERQGVRDGGDPWTDFPTRQGGKQPVLTAFFEVDNLNSTF